MSMNFNNVFSQTSMLGGSNHTVLNNFAPISIGPFNTAPSPHSAKLVPKGRVSQPSQLATLRRQRETHVEACHSRFISSSAATKLAIMSLNQLTTATASLSAMNPVFYGILTDFIHVGDNYSNAARVKIVCDVLESDRYEDLNEKMNTLDTEFKHSDDETSKLLAMTGSSSSKASVIYALFEGCTFLDLGNDQIILGERTFDLADVEAMLYSLWAFVGKPAECCVLSTLLNLLILIGLLRETAEQMTEVKARMSKIDLCVEKLCEFIVQTETWDELEKSLLNSHNEEFPDPQIRGIGRNGFSVSAVAREVQSLDHLRTQNITRLVMPLSIHEFSEKYFGASRKDFEGYVAEEIRKQFESFKFGASLRLVFEHQSVKLVATVPVGLRRAVSKNIDQKYPQKIMRRRSQIFDDIDAMEVDEEE